MTGIEARKPGRLGRLATELCGQQATPFLEGCRHAIGRNGVRRRPMAFQNVLEL